MQTTEEFWSRKQFSEAPNNIENWLMARQRIGKSSNKLGFNSFLHHKS